MRRGTPGVGVISAAAVGRRMQKKVTSLSFRVSNIPSMSVREGLADLTPVQTEAIPILLIPQP